VDISPCQPALAKAQARLAKFKGLHLPCFPSSQCAKWLEPDFEAKKSQEINKTHSLMHEEIQKTSKNIIGYHKLN
jgi:hypothetical protein